MRFNSLVRLTTMFTAAGLLAVACSDDEGGTVARAEVEQEAATQLAEVVGQGEPDIACPDDLDAEVGATMECELSVEGDPVVLPVYIEVTEVEDGDALFDVEVGEEPIE